MEIEVYYYERPALVDQFIAQSTDRETCGWVIPSPSAMSLTGRAP